MDKLIKVRVPESRIKALDYFIKLKGSTLEAEMEKAVDMLYDKFVPKEVRSYVEGTQPEADSVNDKHVCRKRSGDAGDGSPV
jgi:hypothetical protein